MKKASLLFLFVLFFSSCSAVDKIPQKKFGDDSYFYLGLKAADSGNEKEAIRNFKIAVKKGNQLISRRSAESLTLLGTAKERIEAAKALSDRFSDEEAQLFACHELYRNGEYAEVIKITDGINLTEASNELLGLRMFSLIEKEDSRLDEEFYRWFVSRPLSPQHLEIYQSYKELEFKQLERIQSHAKEFQDKLNRIRIMEKSLALDYLNEEEVPEQSAKNPQDNSEEGLYEDFITDAAEIESPRQTIIDYRVSVFRKKYRECFENINKILSIYKNFDEEIDCQLLSDIGKVALYGTNDYYSTARKFDRMAQELNSNQAYYVYFYAARLYDKGGRYQSQAVSRFKSALKNAADENQYDNCLWYLLNFQLRTSTDDIIGTLKDYGANINSPSYFDDFFESLAVLLLSNHKWQDFYKVWKETDSNFSERIAGKYAYISGRLIEEGLAEGDKELKTRQTVDAFTKVLAGGGDLYYKVCAMERLNLSEEEMVHSMLLSKEKIEIQEEETGEAGKLLAGYAAFGFPQKIYGEYMANRNGLSVKDSIQAAKFLNQCAVLDTKNTNDYNVQSLRIAARCYSNATGKIPMELLQLTFPRFYKKQIEEACEKNELPQYLFYALVRSESFFDSQIASRAGAMGLTQLMEATAADSAKKLKMESYDIFDPETNLQLGAYYLTNLLSRSESNSKILALFAYNAGLTHVRNWISAAKKDWASTGRVSRGPAGIPTDLFLETLPFTETREYGRKLVSAAALYGWLYEEKTPADVVREILY